MAEWTVDDMASGNMDVAPIILKAIPAEAYQMPTPPDARYQVNPDGATFAAVANLRSLSDPDVRAWVARHKAPGVLIMACFSPGMETAADIAAGWFKITKADHDAIRLAARRELARHLDRLGLPTGYLST